MSLCRRDVARELLSNFNNDNKFVDSVELAARTYATVFKNDYESLYAYPLPPGGNGGCADISSVGVGGSGRTWIANNPEFYVDSDGSIHKREKPKYKYKDFYSVNVGDIHNSWIVIRILRDQVYFSNTSGYKLTRDIIRERMLECKSTL